MSDNAQKNQSGNVNLETVIEKILKTQFNEIKKQIEKSIQTSIALGKNERDLEINDYVEHTKRRLKAYPDLIVRIEKLTQDIEDLKKECCSPDAASYKSKDIAKMCSTGGIRLSKEEIFEARIFSIEKQIIRDQTEVDELKWALECISNDEYYEMLEYKYFEKLSDEEIAEKMFCDKTTVWRNVGKLIKHLNTFLYGANAGIQPKHANR